MLEIKKPIRMCVCCRGRFYQKELLRLKCKDKILSLWDRVGRSFYLCKDCLKSEKVFAKAIYKQCKNKSGTYIKDIKKWSSK